VLRPSLTRHHGIRRVILVLTAIPLFLLALTIAEAAAHVIGWAPATVLATVAAFLAGRRTGRRQPSRAARPARNTSRRNRP
jgi:hypothetical protein